jgi:hypothetical protein
VPFLGAYNSAAAQTYAPGAAISSASYNSSSNAIQIKVLSVNQDNMLTLATGNSGWSTPEVLDQSTITNSDMVSVALSEPGRIRTYYQNEGGAIAEFLTDDGTTWTSGQASLPLTTD